MNKKFLLLFARLDNGVARCSEVCLLGVVPIQTFTPCRFIGILLVSSRKKKTPFIAFVFIAHP